MPSVRPLYNLTMVYLPVSDKKEVRQCQEEI